MKSERRVFLSVFLAAIAFRLLWYAVISAMNPQSCFVTYDSRGYLELAKNLFSIGSFGRFYDGIWYNEFFRTPLYPYLLGVFGVVKMPLSVIILFQIFLSSATCLLASMCAMALTGNKLAALVAGLLVALDVPSILVSTLILTESVFTFFILLIFYFLVKMASDSKPDLKIPGEPVLGSQVRQDSSGIKRTAKFPFLLCGILFGLAALTRPSGILLFFSLVPFFLFSKISKSQIGFFLIPVLLIISPWILRNKNLTGNYFFSTAGTDSFFFYPASSVYSKNKNIPLKQARIELEQRATGLTGGNPMKRMEAEQTITRSLIYEYPLSFVREFSAGIFYFFAKPARDQIDRQLGFSFSLENTDETKPSEIRTKKSRSFFAAFIAGIQILQLAELWVFFAIGLFVLFRQKKWNWFYLFLFTVLMFSVSIPGSYADYRFRVPAVPIAAIVASVGFVFIIRKEKRFQ